MECVKYSVKPDIILFNGAIDAYIRYVYFSTWLYFRIMFLAYVIEVIYLRIINPLVVNFLSNLFV